MRFLKTSPGEYYHIYNRGAFKQNLFKDSRDYARFLFYILYGQSPVLFNHVTRLVKTFNASEGFAVPPAETNDVIQNRGVELTAFCVMPNHYHLVVKEIQEGGIAYYLQRIGTGYTKYFNTKYETSGRIFESAYKARHVGDNNYLLYLSTYIHRNPRELKQWKDKEFHYPWSSLQDFTEGNRWGGLLMSDIIADQFDTTSNSNYKDFVKTSTAKILKKELGELL
ncbi:MAG: transposase [Patescibacteria group bacterium]